MNYPTPDSGGLPIDDGLKAGFYPFFTKAENDYFFPKVPAPPPLSTHKSVQKWPKCWALNWSPEIKQTKKGFGVAIVEFEPPAMACTLFPCVMGWVLNEGEQLVWFEKSRHGRLVWFGRN
jgi:hypothetical protein